MFKQKENRINFSGSTVFAFLIFLILVAFTENQDRGVVAGPDLTNSVELYYNPAVIVEIQHINFLENLIQPADYCKFKLSDKGSVLISDNNIIHHQIIFRERAGFLIRPVILRRHFNLYHACDTGELPPLS